MTSPLFQPNPEIWDGGTHLLTQRGHAARGGGAPHPAAQELGAWSLWPLTVSSLRPPPSRRGVSTQGQVTSPRPPSLPTSSLTPAPPGPLELAIGAPGEAVSLGALLLHVSQLPTLKVRCL